MVNLTKVIEKILKCNQCKKTVNHETAIAYSECSHLYCDSCKPIICKDCNALGTKQYLKNDEGLFNLYRTLSNINQPDNSKGASIFEVPFNLLLEKHKESNSYTIPENILNRAKQSGLYPGSTTANSSGRKNNRVSTVKSRNSEKVVNVNESAPLITSKRNIKRPRYSNMVSIDSITPKRGVRRSENGRNVTTPSAPPKRGIKRTSC